MVNPLARILLRELWHLRGQVTAAALVVACGIAAFVAMHGTWHSLVVAQADYYARYRFADVFANLKRAPQPLDEAEFAEFADLHRHQITACHARLVAR